MGHSQDEKTRNHDRIVEIAAAKIREAGTDGPGVAEIMAAAGLTHGGFYKHFGSRDELVAAAVEHALADGERAMEALIEGAENPLATYVDWYTSPGHRDDPAHGCAVAALGGDVPRAAPEVRAAYADQVERYIAALAGLIGGEDDDAARRAAITSLCALVGGVLVARALGDDALSAEILSGVRAAVQTQSFESDTNGE